MTMLIYAQPPDGVKHSVEVSMEDDVGTLREKIADVLGLENVTSIGLRIGEEMLEDDAVPIADAGVCAEQEIFCFDKWINVVYKGGGEWGEHHPGLEVQHDQCSRLVVKDTGIFSFNGLWSRATTLPSDKSVIRISFSLHSTRPMDHRHMVGLIPMENYSPSTYLDTSSHNCIAYEVSGKLIAGSKSYPTLPVSTSGPVDIELFFCCESHAVDVIVAGESVCDTPVDYWPGPSCLLYPFVTLNSYGDYAEPSC
eukprot:TRINITY_DN4729_c5_g1_i1.p1 TRINITY_DN4729_c5_g1~~TRINITY_DN4729_c5_g1_i1.p1  ORF type:complete len:266 (+),score=33.96 TRINITY_DN4729_c5_g1_i1:41-799(+)